MQHEFVGHIAEVHIHEADIALEFGVGDGAVRLVGMAPRPFARTLLALGYVAVLVDDGVDEGDITFVGLGLHFQELEDPRRARARHDDGVDLHGDLREVEGELPAHVEESDDGAHAYRRVVQPREREVAHAREHQRAADYRDQHEGDMPDIADGGHEDVGVAVRLAHVAAKLPVDGGEVTLRGFLVAEHLDDLLPVEHLFDETFRPAYGLLLFDEVLRALAADDLGDDEHDRHAPEDDEGEIDAASQHDDEQGDYARHGEDDAGQALRHELPDGVGVVGEVAHDIAVRVRVEVLDGEGLHPVEHVRTDMLQEPLSDDRHHAVVGERADEPEGVYARHYAGDGRELALDGVEAEFDPRGDDFVDEHLEEHRRAYARYGGHDDAEEHEQQLEFVVVCEIAHQTHDDGGSVFLCGVILVFHAFSPPLSALSLPMADEVALAASASSSASTSFSLSEDAPALF